MSSPLFRPYPLPGLKAWKNRGRGALFLLDAGSALPPGAVFSRGSDATWVDQYGIVRFANQNLLQRSQELATAPWGTSTASVGADVTTAPDGTTTADRITASGANGLVFQSVSTTASPYIVSVYAKADTSSTVRLDLVTSAYGAGASCTFTLTGAGSAGSVTHYGASSGFTAAISAIGNGWYRVSLTGTTTAATWFEQVVVPTNGQAVFAWGAQFQRGSLVQDYLPTTSAAVYACRTGHYVSGVGPLDLLEGSRTNLAVRSEAINDAAWTKSGTGTTVDGADTSCGVSLSRMTDSDGAANYQAIQNVTFTGDGTKAFSCIIKAGTVQAASGAGFGIFDATAGQFRAFATVTWNAGVPTVTATNGVDLGTVALGGGCYRLNFQATGVVAANTNSVRLYPAVTAAQTGDVLVGGIQAENASFPSSYIPTTSAAVTRAADALSFPFLPPPQAMTVYVDGYDLGTALGMHGLLGVSTATRYLWLYGNSATSIGSEHNNGSVARTSNVAVTAPFGNRLEMRTVLASDGAVTTAGAISGGTETVGSASAASSLATTWGNTTLLLNDYDTTKPGFFAFRRVLVLSGVRSLSECRRYLP